MYAKNAHVEDVRAAFEKVNRAWDGNIVLENVKQVSANCVTFKLGTANSRAKGSRVSGSGRHGKYACTHVFADMMQALMDVRPDVIFKRLNTGIEVDNQRSLDMHVDQADHCNFGSLFQPAYLGDLCVASVDDMDYCESKIHGCALTV